MNVSDPLLATTLIALCVVSGFEDIVPRDQTASECCRIKEAKTAMLTGFSRFLHQLPNNLDTTALTNAMSRVEISSEGYARPSTPAGYTPQEEFPDLLSVRGSRPGARFDPSRNRFANAVKRATPMPMPTLQVTGSRLGPTATGPFSPGGDMRPIPAVLAVPRPSQRIKLRPATLLPTLRTGTAANEQYMSNRANAIRLGHARNACLARAADAFRRGDGAAAKRFSREGKALNQRMINEASEVAQTLVRERREEAQKAIRERDPGWTDDPSDRSERGKECAGGLGVIMGIASRKSVSSGVGGGGGGGGGERLSAEERAEALLDLHTLHGNEGAEIAGQFLAEVSASQCAVCRAQTRCNLCLPVLRSAADTDRDALQLERETFRGLGE